jgi:acyl-CoA hydrolase
VLAWVDICAAVSAQRFCRGDVVTASIDSVSFASAIKVGEVAVLRASVNRAWNTSMEIGVKVEAEDRYTGTRRHTSTAYLTFVALAASGAKIPVPTLVPETPEEQQRFEAAGRRRDRRLAHRSRE